MRKQILSTVLAAVCAVSLGPSAYATNASSEEHMQDTMQIGDYTCFVNDGLYYTEVDEEIYQVINLDEITFYEDASYESNSAKSQSEIDVTNGHYYGEIDITNGDDSTPVFVGRQDYTSTGFIMHVGFVFSNYYKVVIHSYNLNTAQWYKSDETSITFGVFTQDKLLFSGTNNKAISKIQIDFLQSGSTGEQTFEYEFYAQTKPESESE